LFAGPDAGDYHVQSTAGRWDPNAGAGSGAWTADAASSPAIDAGNPATAYDREPAPNGGRINLGRYGGTAEASKSGNGQETGVVLTLSADFFAAGDRFLLTHTLANAGAAPLDIELWVLLDAAGVYFFYPNWTEAPDWVPAVIPARTVSPPAVLLDFTWPATAAHGSGIVFWGAILFPGGQQLAGAYDWVTFDF